MSLNVMVLESDHGAADAAVRELTDAGHVVLRCHDPDAPAFPCRGLHDKSECPLESHVVDVALTVRSGHRSQPTAHEDGVRCALMHRVPLVVSGESVPDPYEAYEVRALDRGGDVVRACEEVAESELPQHSRIATDALPRRPLARRRARRRTGLRDPAARVPAGHGQRSRRTLDASTATPPSCA